MLLAFPLLYHVAYDAANEFVSVDLYGHYNLFWWREAEINMTKLREK